MQETITDTGVMTTENASRYLQQLCKHFAHKIEVRFDANSGEAALPVGPATLRAEGTLLEVKIQANDEAGLDKARGIIDRHLERFAFREPVKTLIWAGKSA